MQSYFKAPKNIILNPSHYFIKRISNKQELQQIVIHHSSDIGFRASMKLYNKCTRNHIFLVIDTTLDVLDLIWIGYGFLSLAEYMIKK